MEASEELPRGIPPSPTTQSAPTEAPRRAGRQKVSRVRRGARHPRLKHPGPTPKGGRVNQSKVGSKFFPWGRSTFPGEICPRRPETSSGRLWRRSCPHGLWARWGRAGDPRSHGEPDERGEGPPGEAPRGDRLPIRERGSADCRERRCGCVTCGSLFRAPRRRRALPEV